MHNYAQHPQNLRYVQSENLKSKNKNLSEYESWHQQSAHLTNKQLRGSGVGQHSAWNFPKSIKTFQL